MSGQMGSKLGSVAHLLGAVVLALFVPILAQATSAPPLIPCNPGTICIANQSGAATGSVAAGLSLSNADVTQIGAYTYGLGVSSLNFSTGSFITGSGSLQNGGQFNGGGSFTVSTTGTWNGFTGAIFTGTFDGPVTWTLVTPGCTTNCTYNLTGAVSGTWANGETVTGATTQLFFKTTKGKYAGGTITPESGTTFIFTPEPGTLGLMGTGMVGVGLMIRRRVKQQL